MTQVARRGNASGCRVLGFECHVLRIDDVAIEQVELDDLLSRSDIVSLHAAGKTSDFQGAEHRASTSHCFRDAEAISAKADIALHYLEDFLSVTLQRK